ncbi:MAG: hypothetical protein ACI9JM_001937 [Halioglobus sp.]|jgi:hypothetical protein
MLNSTFNTGARNCNALQCSMPLFPLLSPSLFLRLSFLLALFCSPGQAATEGFYAAQITEDNSHQLPRGGIDAIGGMGDWFMRGGELCAAVSSKEHATYLSLHGGVLVDLWHCASANDQWSTGHAQHNLQKEEIPPTQMITAGFDEQQSWIETVAVLSGLQNTTRYTLKKTQPDQLLVNTRITRIEDGKSLGMYGNSFLHPRGSLTPFTLDTRQPENSRGFDQPAIDTANRTAILSAVGTFDLQILLGSRHITPPLSYGIHMRSVSFEDSDGKRTPINAFMMGGQTFTLFGAFTRTFPSWWSQTPGAVSFLMGLFFDLDIAQSFNFDMAIHVGDRADAASITDRIYLGPQISGRLDTPEASITVKNSQGHSLTFVRPKEDGSFAFLAPADTGDLTLQVTTAWSKETLQVSNTGSPRDLGLITTGARGIVQLPSGEPMALIFQAASGNPIFHDELTLSTVGGTRALSGPESQRINLCGCSFDLPSVELQPGKYRVIATRGAEYGTSEVTVEVTAGKTVSLNIAPPLREVQSKGFIGADLHVHSGIGFDSSLLPRQRIADFIAQGGELLITTEHNITHDLQPTIEAMGVGHLIRSFPGIEITGMIRTESVPTSIGHSNVFPVVVDPSGFMGGTLPFEDKRLGEVIGDYKAQYPQSIFQLNHPRTVEYDDDIAFFNHLSQGREYDPSVPLHEAPNASLIEKIPGNQYRDIDFDAMELLGGEAMNDYFSIRQDWFSLLQQNIYKIATANSDSHESKQLIGYPRTLLRLDNKRIENVTTDELVAAVSSGNLYGTTGPILTVALGTTPPGETFIGARGVLQLNVETASWVNVDKAKIWINGELWQTLSIVSGEVLTIPIEVEKDSFIFVEVLGQASEKYKILASGFQPFAFANPIFIDIGGNGWRYGED